MPSEDSQTTEASQSSRTNPWENAQPLLDKAIAGYKGLDTSVTGSQQSAIDQLLASVQGLPNFGQQGADAIRSLFSSSTAPQVGMLTDAFSGLSKNLGATASGAELDPYSTPGFGDAINTMTGDITDRIKAVYAGAGRDPSGAGSFAGSLGRGLTEGIAPVIQSQYNKNKDNQMGAAGTLFNAAGSTATGMTAQQQSEFGDRLKAMAAAAGVGDLFQDPAKRAMGAADTAYGAPFANLAKLLQPATALGGMGGQQFGTSTQTTTQPQSAFSNILGGITSGAGILSSLGGSGGGMGALSSLLGLIGSDERMKDNIEEVGELHDGQKVYSYTYKGSDLPQIGLLAQEVAEEVPEAVGPFGDTGLLGVNYRKATRRAAEMARAA